MYTSTREKCAFRSFKTPKTDILKQLQMKIGSLLKIWKVLKNEQKATKVITTNVVEFHRYQPHRGPNHLLSLKSSKMEKKECFSH